jgi:hypothetical protein
MSDHFSEYHLQHHLNGRRSQLMQEARQERLKAELVHTARQQAQYHPDRLRIPNLLNGLRAALRLGTPRPITQECKPLEPTTP